MTQHFVFESVPGYSPIHDDREQIKEPVAAGKSQRNERTVWTMQNKFYFTFGTWKQYPYTRGQYLVVIASDEHDAAIQSMQQLHEKIADMNIRYYDLRGKIVKAERRIAALTERGEMWEQYNQYKSIHKQLAKVKPEKREQFEQRHSRELILYDAAARYLKELKDSGEAITPKAWQREIDQLTAGKQTDTLSMKSMREDLKAVERLRKTADQLSRQERDKSHDRGPER